MTPWNKRYCWKSYSINKKNVLITLWRTWRERFFSPNDLMHSLSLVYIYVFVLLSSKKLQLLYAQLTLYLRMLLRDRAQLQQWPTTILSFKQSALEIFPAGSLVFHFYQQNNTFIFEMMTKLLDLHKTTCKTLQFSLWQLKQNLESRNVIALAISQLGGSFDQLPWPTRCSVLRKVFSGWGWTKKFFSVTAITACH